MISKQKSTAQKEKMQHKLDAGLLSARFPEVAGITIEMTYFQKSVNPVLMQRTVNMHPGSYAYFTMECMKKGCTGGGFNLERVITSMIKRKKKSGEGELVCSGDDVPGHAKIAYTITIHYH